MGNKNALHPLTLAENVLYYYLGRELPSNIMQKRLRSNWRNEVPGKALTSRRIKQYIRKGYYGEAEQIKLKKLEAAERARRLAIRKDTDAHYDGNPPHRSAVRKNRAAQPETKEEWKDFFSFLD